MPKMDYLPLGNKNMMESRFTPPPGISYNERKAMGDFIYRELKPYIESEKDGYPQIDSFVLLYLLILSIPITSFVSARLDIGTGNPEPEFTNIEYTSFVQQVKMKQELWNYSHY